MPDEWETLLRLTGDRRRARAPDADVAALDDFVAARGGAAARSPTRTRRWHGRDAGEVLAALAPRAGARAAARPLLRSGPYDLTLADLEAAPHGIDLGPLEPRLPEVLRTPSGQDRARARGDRRRRRRGCTRRSSQPRTGGIVLVGRRDLRSNNSWMHNLPLLVRGPARCTAARASRRRAAPRARRRRAARASRSRAGAIEVPVEVTDDDHARRRLASRTAGATTRRARAGVAARARRASTPTCWPTSSTLDPLSGTAVLNGIPVRWRRSPPALRLSLPRSRGRRRR